jgi:ATP-dependent Lon protease
MAAEEHSAQVKVPSVPEPEVKNVVIKENQKGVSYHRLFAAYLKGAKEIHLTDPYLRKLHQVKNLKEFCEMLYRIKPVGDEIRLKVFTNAEPGEKQEADSYLIQVQNNLQGTGINMDYVIEPTEAQHDRYLETDTGWKIILGRGLDIFQRYDYKDAFNLANALQEERMCKPFEVTYVRVGNT